TRRCRKNTLPPRGPRGAPYGALELPSPRCPIPETCLSPCTRLVLPTSVTSAESPNLGCVELDGHVVFSMTPWCLHVPGPTNCDFPVLARGPAGGLCSRRL